MILGGLKLREMEERVTSPYEHALSSFVDRDRLARNRMTLLAAAVIGEPGRARSLLSRMGVPDHLLGLLAATPSLRRSSSPAGSPRR